MANFGFFSGNSGILKLVTLIVGLAALIITCIVYTDNDFFGPAYAARHGTSQKPFADFLLSMVIIAFVISLIWALLIILEAIQQSDTERICSIIYHLLAGILLIIAAVLWLNENWCSKLTGSAAYLALINGVVYILVVVQLFQKA